MGIGYDYFGFFLPRELEEPPLKACVGIATAISLFRVIVSLPITRKRGK